jgi:hypothetical protein
LRNQPRNDAVHRRRHLGVDLVRRHLDHRVALGDEVALGDVPLEHDSLGDRLAHLGHLDLDGRRLCHLASVYETGSLCSVPTGRMNGIYRQVV